MRGYSRYWSALEGAKPYYQFLGSWERLGTTSQQHNARRMKDGHDVSGTNRDNWEFFDAMDQVLGSPHSVDPPTTIDTSQRGHATSQSTDVDANTGEGPTSPRMPPSPITSNTPSTTTLPFTSDQPSASTSRKRQKGKSPTKKC